MGWSPTSEPNALLSWLRRSCGTGSDALAHGFDVADRVADRVVELAVVDGRRLGALVAVRVHVAGPRPFRQRVAETEAARPEHAHAIGRDHLGRRIGRGWRFAGGPKPPKPPNPESNPSSSSMTGACTRSGWCPDDPTVGKNARAHGRREHAFVRRTRRRDRRRGRGSRAASGARRRCTSPTRPVVARGRWRQRMRLDQRTRPRHRPREHDRPRDARITIDERRQRRGVTPRLFGRRRVTGCGHVLALGRGWIRAGFASERPAHRGITR